MSGKIFVVLAAFLTASAAFARRVGEWHDDVSGSYYDGSGNIDYTLWIWGILLGILIQRMFEKKMDIDEGWLHTILMSMWFCTPVSIVLVAIIFH